MQGLRRPGPGKGLRAVSREEAPREKQCCPIKTFSALCQKPPGERTEAILQNCPPQGRTERSSGLKHFFSSWLSPLFSCADGQRSSLRSALEASRCTALGPGWGKGEACFLLPVRTLVLHPTPPLLPKESRGGGDVGLAVRTPGFRASNPANLPRTWHRSPSLPGLGSRLLGPANAGARLWD